MEIDFIPLDYDSFDWQGRNCIKIIGRDSHGKHICVIDSFEPYLWAILKDNIAESRIKGIQEKISSSYCS